MSTLIDAARNVLRNSPAIALACRIAGAASYSNRHAAAIHLSPATALFHAMHTR